MKNSGLLERLIRNWPVKVLAIAAAILVFLFHRFTTLEERYFSVPLEIEVNNEFVVSGDHPSMARVTIRGKGNTIFNIIEEDVSAVADLTQIETEGVFRVPVELETRGAAQEAGAIEFRVEPVEITVTIEPKVTRSLNVVPQLTGFPPSGYELNATLVTPNSVTVEGPASIVNELPMISTEEIDLTGKSNDFTARVRLIQPESSIVFPGGNTVEVQIEIDEQVLLQTYDNIEIVFIDLPEDLTFTEMPRQGTVRIQGPQSVLSQFRRSNIQLVVDCSDIDSPGTYVLPVRIEAPRGIIVLSYSPMEIRVTVVEYQE
ncbi:MAG: YbbR-like domain-containing protein [Spirochaetia bacterium]